MNAAEPDQIFEDEARLQLNDNGSLRHLLTLKGLDRSLLVDILAADLVQMHPLHKGSYLLGRLFAGRTRQQDAVQTLFRQAAYRRSRIKWLLIFCVLAMTLRKWGWSIALVVVRIRRLT